MINGVGMGDVKKIKAGSGEFGHGVGLSNINRRLKELYGKGLVINSSPRNGTEVTWFISINR